MKIIYSFIVVSLTSISSMACPNLSGEWSCRTNEGESVKMNFTSINKEDINLLMMLVDVGTSVQTSETLVLNVGKRKGKDYSYSAMCSGNSIKVDLETVFGPIKLVYNLLSSNELLMSSTGEHASDSKVLTCKKLSLLK